MPARLRFVFFRLTPCFSNQSCIDRRICSLTGTPSRSQTSCRPSYSSSSIRNVTVRRAGVITCLQCKTLYISVSNHESLGSEQYVPRRASKPGYETAESKIYMWFDNRLDFELRRR